MDKEEHCIMDWEGRNKTFYNYSSAPKMTPLYEVVRESPNTIKNPGQKTICSISWSSFPNAKSCQVLLSLCSLNVFSVCSLTV